MTKRIKNFSSLTDKEIIKKLSADDYEGGNILLSPNASWETKKKYLIGKKILTYQQQSNLSLEVIAKKLTISEEKLYDICRGKVNDFTEKDLKNYLDKLEEKKFIKDEKESWIEGSDYAKAKTSRNIPQFTPEFYLEKLKVKKC